MQLEARIARLEATVSATHPGTTPGTQLARVPDPGTKGASRWCLALGPLCHEKERWFGPTPEHVVSQAEAALIQTAPRIRWSRQAMP